MSRGKPENLGTYLDLLCSCDARLHTKWAAYGTRLDLELPSFMIRRDEACNIVRMVDLCKGTYIPAGQGA